MENRSMKFACEDTYDKKLLLWKINREIVFVYIHTGFDKNSTQNWTAREKPRRDPVAIFTWNGVRYRDDNRDRPANHLHTVAPYETVNNGSYDVRRVDHRAAIMQRRCARCGCV